MYTYGSRRTTPVIPPGDFPPELESLLERMKRLDFSKPVTRRLTPGSNDYTNPTTVLLKLCSAARYRAAEV